jgi:hypothetical protein
MNNEKDKINDILKEVHEKIEPRDSWQDLRKRIDKKIENKSTSGLITKLNGNIYFWRRIALAAAACLIITSALLIYVIFDTKSNHFSANQGNLLAQNQLKQLGEAFSQVQNMFSQNCPWIMITSTGKGEIGVGKQDINSPDAKKVIVLRLAVNLNEEQNIPQYFDVVTFDNQLVNFNMPLTEDSNINIILKSVITSNNRIEVEINTELNGGVKTSNTVTIADNSYKTLTRIKSNGSWININATGQSLSNI